MPVPAVAIAAAVGRSSFPHLPGTTMNLTQTKISTRLALGFGALAALMVLLSGAALYFVQTIDQHFDTVMDNRYPKVQIAGAIKAVNNEVSLALRNLFVVSDPDDIQAQYDIIAGSSKRRRRRARKSG